MTSESDRHIIIRKYDTSTIVKLYERYDFSCIHYDVPLSDKTPDLVQRKQNLVPWHARTLSVGPSACMRVRLYVFCGLPSFIIVCVALTTDRSPFFVSRLS